MFSRILVPVDGSPLAEQAVPFAAHIARATGGTVLLMRALAPGALGYYEPALGPYVGPPPGLLQQESTDAQAYLTRISGWPVLSGLAVETDPVVGLAAPAIAHVSEEWHADLVVLTTHGRTGLTRWVLGSVAQHIARQSTVPVLVLRSTDTPTPATGADVTSAGAHPAGRVLVPLDGSALAESTLAPAVALGAALASPAPAELHLLMIVDRFMGAMTATPERLVVGGAEGYLERITQQLEREYGRAVRVTWSVSVDADIAGAILRVAERGAVEVDASFTGGVTGQTAARPDVIAMATHGRAGFARWALGSVTERVLHGAKLPLLIVRPRHIGEGASPLLAEQA